jgi:MutS domain V/MutS domain III
VSSSTTTSRRAIPERPEPVSAAAEYRTRLERRRATRDAFDLLDVRYSYARLAVFATGIVLALLAWHGSFSAALLVAPGIAFVWLMRRHDRVVRLRDRATHAIRLYEHGLARLNDQWIDLGESGDRFRDDTHVYANDLDLFGRGSLFQLLSQARTRTGEETLAGWLRRPAEAREIQARQRAVAELASQLDVREDLALAGTDVRRLAHTDRLLEWAERPMPPATALRTLTWVFTVATLAAIASVASSTVWAPLGIVLVAQAVGFRRFRDQIDSIVSAREPEAVADFVADALTHRAMDLAVLTDLLQVIERETFTCDRLIALRRRLQEKSTPASRIIGQLRRLSVLHDSERNALFVPLILFFLGYLELSMITAAVIQLIRPHIALAVDSWRKRHGPRVRGWIEAVAELEALSSLAGYRFERADHTFPEIVVDNGGLKRPAAAFDAIRLAHPLLPAATVVPNDVHFAGDTQLLVVSGSNMSGKSTLLRTVGVNVVLALAGAPVRAASLRLSPLAIGATLRIQDSLQQGRSRFYAEITRIREIADLADGPIPLLFLLDELFHGTNSHDRLVGASGVLKNLLDRGAIGLITTHDLALTAVADRLAPRAVNVHFEDWFEGERIQFDYVMKPGPVTRSNAIALMRAVGLELPEERSG